MGTRAGSAPHSNVASTLFARRQHLELSPAPADEQEQGILSELPQTFPPEFLNRLDEVIIFHPLTAQHVRATAAMHLQGWVIASLASELLL